MTDAESRPLHGHVDRRYQLAGKLRRLADAIEQEGRAVDGADISVLDDEATVVAMFDLEPEIVTDGGQSMVIVSGGDRRRRYHEQESCYYVTEMTDPTRVPKADMDVDGCAYCTDDAVDPEELIEVCPECDSPQFQAVMGSGFDAPKVDHDYRCRNTDCQGKFDEPVTRPRRGNSKTLGGLAGKLLKADQDDVSAEHVEDDDEQLVTDGGEVIVLVSSSAGRRGNTTYHRDESCGYVQRMAGTVEKPLRVLNGHYDPCSRCASEDVLADGGESPLDRIFVEDVEDRPDEIVVNELTTLDADEFVARLESLAEAAEAVSTMSQDLQRLRQTGLEDHDALHLIYGRNNSLTKKQIRSMFAAIDELVAGRADRPTERLLSDVSGLNLSETSELMDELDRLNQRYGELDDE